MSNFEWSDLTGSWLFHSLITSDLLARMAENEQANHENKVRLKTFFDSTYEIDENDGNFIPVIRDEPSHTLLLCGVRSVGDPELAGKTSETFDLLFPTGVGLGPFTRSPVVTHSVSGFTIPGGDGGADWQTADVTADDEQIGLAEWPLVALARPSVQVDNFKAGLTFLIRRAGFNFTTPTNFPADGYHYVFWHAAGPIAAHN